MRCGIVSVQVLNVSLNTAEFIQLFRSNAVEVTSRVLGRFVTDMLHEFRPTQT